MFGFLKTLFKKKQSNADNTDVQSDELKKFRLSGNIRDNLDRLNKIMNNSGDIHSREFNLAGSNMKAAIMYISTLANEDMVQEHILKPLIVESAVMYNKTQVGFQEIKNSMLSSGNIEEVESFDEIVLGIMSGNTLVIVQGFTKGLIISTSGYQGRTVGEPALEPSIKGPQEAFVEILKVNVGLIRRRLRDPNLCFEMSKIGRRSKSNYAIVYIKGIVKEELVTDIKERLSGLDLDEKSTVSQLGTMIVDRPSSIFPQIQATERPDKVVSAITEGRVAVMMDGTPDVLLAPATLPILMQSPDDYFENWLISSTIRITRYIALFISGLFPAIYIAITSFHPGMLPTQLILSIARTRTGVPFPAMIEAIIMEFVLELLQEAGVRLPRVVGQTVSIVGGLVIGQAAVAAGIVSPIMVIIVSITAITSYTIPDYSLGLATRIIRVPFMILASALGGFGIAIGLLISLTYIASLKSFGVNYLKPISTDNISDWKDGLIRMPLLSMKKRPEMFNPQDPVRMNIKKRRGSDEN
jgi:spore germination protein